jgi:hypothetical protein
VFNRKLDTFFSPFSELTFGGHVAAEKSGHIARNFHSTRIMGAMRALGGAVDLSGGAYFWNATSQQDDPNPGWNWTQYNNGTYVITTAVGGTTFFKYANGRTWP